MPNSPDKPHCIECLKQYPQVREDAVAVVPVSRPRGGRHWILMCEDHLEEWNNTSGELPEPVWLESESYDREDDSEEVKREAERTPCPKCGKLPEVQQHVDGLGVSHRCSGKDRLHLCPAEGEVVFSGYAPDWIEEVKQIKKKAEETCCPQCEKPPRIDVDGRLGCQPSVCSNATGSYSHGGWLNYCENSRDWWAEHPVEAEIRRRGNEHDQEMRDTLAEINSKLDKIPG